MAALVLVLESELAPAVALQLPRALEIIRCSSKFSPPQRAAAKMHVTMLGWALVTEARKEKGSTTASSNLRDAMKAVCGSASGAPKAETASSVVEACKRDEDARGAAKGGDAGGRGLAVEGRGVQLGWLAGWQRGCRHATRLCLCSRGAAGAAGWRWPVGGHEPAASWCTSWSVGGTGCLGADAGLIRWSNPSGTPPHGVRPALDGAETSAAASKRGTSRTPRQAQLTESAGCWTRRRRTGVGGGHFEVELPAAFQGVWQGARSPRGHEVTSEP
jgi:hypothetical protein